MSRFRPERLRTVLGRVRASILLLLLAVVLTSCQKEPDTQEPLVMAQDEFDAMLVFIFDLSGSFRDRVVGDDGKSFQFALETIANAFLARTGMNDRIVLSQVSAQKERPTLWAGSPKDFKRDFKSAKALADYLASNSSPEGSPIFAGVAENLEYTLSFHRRQGSHMQSMTLLFSDMLDTSPAAEKQKERMLADLKEYSKYGGFGIYWIHPSQRGVWETHLRDCGYHGAIEVDIVTRPPAIKFN